MHKRGLGSDPNSGIAQWTIGIRVEGVVEGVVGQFSGVVRSVGTGI